MPGSSKHFLIKTVEKIGDDWEIEDKEGNDYSGGNADMNSGGSGWHAPPCFYNGQCGGGWGGGVALGGRRKRSPCGSGSGGGGGWGGGKK